MLWYARQAPSPASLKDAADVKNAPSDSVAAPVPAADSTPSEPVAEKKSAPAAVLTARLGVVASRSAVGNAVQRARAKRRLREAFRHQQTLVPPGHDLLLVARSALNRLEYREIEQRFVTACRKIFPSAQA